MTDSEEACCAAGLAAAAVPALWAAPAHLAAGLEREWILMPVSSSSRSVQAFLSKLMPATSSQVSPLVGAPRFNFCPTLSLSGVATWRNPCPARLGSVVWRSHN